MYLVLDISYCISDSHFLNLTLVITSWARFSNHLHHFSKWYIYPLRCLPSLSSPLLWDFFNCNGQKSNSNYFNAKRNYMICNWENPGVVPIVEWNTAKTTAAGRFNHTRVCLDLSPFLFPLHGCILSCFLLSLFKRPEQKQLAVLMVYPCNILLKESLLL